MPLEAMTVLVGHNGSGKSNVVDVLSFVRDAMHMGLSGAITDRGGIDGGAALECGTAVQRCGHARCGVGVRSRLL